MWAPPLGPGPQAGLPRVLKHTAGPGRVPAGPLGGPTLPGKPGWGPVPGTLSRPAQPGALGPGGGWGGLLGPELPPAPRPDQEPGEVTVREVPRGSLMPLGQHRSCGLGGQSGGLGCPCLVSWAQAPPSARTALPRPRVLGPEVSGTPGGVLSRQIPADRTPAPSGTHRSRWGWAQFPWGPHRTLHFWGSSGKPLQGPIGGVGTPPNP